MDTIEHQLLSTFATAWSEAASKTFNCLCESSLTEVDRATEQTLFSVLSMIKSWPAALVAPCQGMLTGQLFCLFKSRDITTLENIAGQPASSNPMPGCRSLIDNSLNITTASFGKRTEVSFGATKYLDLLAEQSRLAAILGDPVWVGTYAIMVGSHLETEMLVFYAPNALLEPANTAQTNSVMARPVADEQQIGTTESAGKPRNIERLLGVELEVVVRFGSTKMPLSEIVRMGTGSMIELNRTVDEPVELIVNDRPLARGEVVVIDGYFGVRITEIIATGERTRQLF
ncbi:MAG: flagellar motor switch protein FliN [Acidobacteriota bacterium]